MSVGRLDRKALAILATASSGSCFQSFNLLARTSALENVELPMLSHQTPACERQVAVPVAALHSVEASRPARNIIPRAASSARGDRAAGERPAHHSGRRTGAVDSRSIEIMSIFQRLNREAGITMIVVLELLRYRRLWRAGPLFLRDGRLRSDAAVPARCRRGAADAFGGRGGRG